MANIEGKQLYDFHPITREFTGGPRLPKLDPRTYKVMQPRHATFLPVPQFDPGQVAVFVGDEFSEDGHWEVVEDNRGKYIYDKNEKRIKGKVQAIKPSLSKSEIIVPNPPPRPEDGWDVTKKEWVTDIAKVKSNKLDALNGELDGLEDMVNKLKPLIDGVKTISDLRSEKQQAVDAAKTVEEVDSIGV
jgi:hypothetical protein